MTGSFTRTLFFLIISISTSFAQMSGNQLFQFSNDTTIAKGDTQKIHSPKRAAIYSAVLPGAGQVYNRQYWKVPVVYVAGLAGGYLIYYNHTIYRHIHKSFLNRKAGEADKYERFTVSRPFLKPLEVDLTNFSDSELLNLRNTYRRDLDLSVLLTAGIYAINIVDALVFAHLYHFDISDDLTMQIHPPGANHSPSSVTFTYYFSR